MSPDRTPRRPATVRFLLRLPAALHAALADGARAAGVSLNEHLNRRLAAAEPHPASAALTPVLLAGARRVAGARLLGIVLHGSWARREARAGSDIDALIVVDEALPLTRGLYRAWDDQPVVWEGRPVDVHFVHPPRIAERAGGVWCEAAIEGRLIADRTGHVDDALIQIRRAIADGRLVRKRAHGQPYCDGGSVIGGEMQNRDLARDYVRRSSGPAAGPSTPWSRRKAGPTSSARRRRSSNSRSRACSAAPGSSRRASTTSPTFC